MPILTSLRQSPTYLYCKVYCVCSIVTLFQAAPLSSRLLSPPNPNPRPRGGGSWGWGWGWGWISRWRRRAADLSGIRAQLARDDVDVRVYPELEWDAEVRRSTRLHADEEAFIRARRARIAHEGGLARFLGVPHHAVDEADVPLIAIGGSGGGHRAMYGFAGFLAAARAHRLWAITTWVAGVSGSCWTLAALYTIARRDMHRLLTHYHAIARQHAHPLSRAALHTVAHSPRGTYFLLAPLLRKATDLRLGLPIPIRIRIMDLYATLTTAFLFLNRHPRARPRLSRHHLQFSKLWTRAHLHKAHHPLPLLTAVRVAPKHKHKHKDASPPGSGFFQWFEISPLEVGCRDVGFVPTWAWGRPFRSGHSLRRQPEHSLALLLGQCTSAPAAPLTAYISALLASLPQGTLISRLLMLLNNFVRMKQWQRRWGNPIRAGDEHNPFYGPETHPPPKQQRGDRGGDRGGGVLGIGVDILHLPRLRALVERRSAGAAHLARRILCRAERDQFGSLPACTEAEAEAKLKWLAVRWAAKEAAYKALYPTFEVRWTDLCIDKPRDARAASPKPRIRFSDEWSRSHRGAEAGPQTPYMHLSVSHDGEYVVANVLAENRPTPPPPPPPPPLPLPPPSPSPSPSPESESESGSGWESGGRIRLMDSGMSNNLPNHVLARKERGADIVIAFDASSDVQTGSALRRIQHFADDCGLTLSMRPDPTPTPTPMPTSDEQNSDSDLDIKFHGRYAQILDAHREDGTHVRLIYCPMLPNAIEPDFDPSTSTFSNSYNLVWTGSQISTAVRVSAANVSRHAIHTIRQAVREVYEAKRAARLGTQPQPQPQPQRGPRAQG